MIPALLLLTAVSAAPIVTTSCGTYAGVTKTIQNAVVDSFLGIRFANAPVGQLRWAPPQPPTCDPGAYFAATTQAAPCIQDSQDPVPGDEDCLFLNVARSSNLTHASLAPVLVFWHGGDLTIGATSWHDVAIAAGAFAEQFGSVVLVFPAYRLNVLGWLATDDLAAEQGGHAGNYGTLDQLEALRWVQVRYSVTHPVDALLLAHHGSLSRACTCNFSNITAQHRCLWR